MAVFGATPAHAHAVADLTVVSPAADETAGSSVEVVISAAPSDTASADFTLALDGSPVGRDGTVGGAAAFTGLSLRAGQRLTIALRDVPAGVHLLTLHYKDADSGKQDVVRRFTVDESRTGATRGKGIAVAVGVALLLAASVAIRRRAFDQR